MVEVLVNVPFSDKYTGELYQANSKIAITTSTAVIKFVFFIGLPPWRPAALFRSSAVQQAALADFPARTRESGRVISPNDPVTPPDNVPHSFCAWSAAEF